MKKIITVAAAALALAASCVVTGVPPSLAVAGSETSSGHRASFAGWYDTDSNAALSRANLIENVLSPSAVAKVKYLRSVVSPLVSPKAFCGPQPIVAPLLAGGYLYAITNMRISKYNPATGGLIWQRTLGRWGIYESLAISANLIIVGGNYSCPSPSSPGGIVRAFNVSTGALVWSAGGANGLTQAVVVGSYVVTAGMAANTDGYNISVLNLSDGKPIWSNGGCQTSKSPDPVVVGLLVMGYGCDSQNNPSIEARNLTTGTLVWSLPGNWTLQRGDLASSAGRHLYATDPSGTVEDLNPHTGQVEYSLSQAVNVLAVDTSRVYASCGNQGSDVCGYNISTGALEWQSTQLISSAALAAEADGVLYLNYGIALNAATGQVIKLLWALFNANFPTAMAVGGGRIAVASDPRVLDLFGLKGY